MTDMDAWTILVADDNPTARAQIVAILSDIGHDPVEVSDGTEAQSALAALSFDIAVLDRDMPGIRGDDLARSLVGKLPLIGLSSAGRTQDEWAGVDLAGWLQKPVDARALAQAVQAAMAGALEGSTRSPDAVDLAHLATYTGGDHALESELAELFRASCDRYFEEMARAQSDERAWKNAAHGLKGASRGIGANEVGRLAAYAETLLGDAMSTRRTEVLDQLRAAADEVNTFFERHLNPGE